jgi:hypothetical protein
VITFGAPSGGAEMRVILQILAMISNSHFGEEHDLEGV